MERIEVIKGDITKTEADAIVNAANSSLMGGGGVDGAIHRAGGPSILEECMRIAESTGGCPPGEAVITGGGKLPAKYVIHTVGPVWRGGIQGEEKALRNCYVNSLNLAAKNACRTIAFPNISTGVYGYPKDLAADISMRAVREYLKGNKEIERVIFVCNDDDNFSYMKEALSGA